MNQQAILDQAAKAAVDMVEKQVDQQLAAIDNMGEDDFMALRRKRLMDLKKKADKIQEWKAKGHGTYREISDQKDWFQETKNSERVICHFYRPTTWRCEIVDKHFEKIAPKHLETKFIKINAEKAPFLCENLNVVLLPTIIIVKDNVPIDRVEGFDSLGGVDTFPTDLMEQRLSANGGIDYDGELTGPKAPSKGKTNFGTKDNTQGKAIYKSSKQFFDPDDDLSFSD
mmetsp:Transcript_24310/g.34322  ORF Transcript_24310/g.34322 Transcript_24310/m.34322 type:complete len:227 (+) Transcript_24310:30-710(+)